MARDSGVCGRDDREQARKGEPARRREMRFEPEKRQRDGAERVDALKREHGIRFEDERFLALPPLREAKREDDYGGGIPPRAGDVIVGSIVKPLDLGKDEIKLA